VQERLTTEDAKEDDSVGRGVTDDGVERSSDIISRGSVASTQQPCRSFPLGISFPQLAAIT
jgi:hypothetical protein